MSKHDQANLRGHGPGPSLLFAFALLTISLGCSFNVWAQGVLMLHSSSLCGSVPGNSENGVSFGQVIGGQSYAYIAYGCVSYATGKYVDPDGAGSTNACDILDIPGSTGTGSFCPGLTNWSLIGVIGGSCVQLGKQGGFTAPISGALTLFCNDKGYFYDNGGQWDVCIALRTDIFGSGGTVGGPFYPSSQMCILTNGGTAGLDWSATNTSSWISLSAMMGTLPTGTATNVLVTINSSANNLIAGSYTSAVLFINLTAGSQVVTQTIVLTIDSHTNSWINLADGVWQDKTNWALSVPPDITQQGIAIRNANSKTVFMNSATATNSGVLTISNLMIAAIVGETNTLRISMGSPSAKLTVLNNLSIAGGGALAISNSALEVGSTSGGYFTVDGAATVLGDAAVQGGTVYLGSRTGSYGVVMVNGGNVLCRDHLLVGGGGSGILWLDGGEVVSTNALNAIGFLGPGQITISNGTMRAGDLAVGCLYTQGVSAAGAIIVTDGELAVSGDYTLIGSSGSGQMTVNAGMVNLGSLLSIGIDKGTGAVWVVGGQLVATNDDTFVGSSGTGNFVLSNGAFQANAVYVGSDPFMSSLGAAISGAATGNVSGGISQGTLTAAGGAMIIRSNLLIGADLGSTGVVWTTGGQIIVTNDTTTIGYSGIGRLTVSNGTVQTLGLFVGQLGEARGTLTMNGGSFLSWGNVVVGDCTTNATGHLIVNGGIVAVTNASHTAVLEVKRGTLTVNGGLLLVDTLVLVKPCAQFVRTGGTIVAGTVIVQSDLDSDADGMPDYWELIYGFNPSNGADADADADGDGMSNVQEYQAGTDPASWASALRITELAAADDDMFIAWPGVGGKRYVLQTTAGSNGTYSNNFVDLNPAIVAPGTGETVVAVLHLGAATNAPAGYYRVRLLSP
jgi:fibronectin-binding autotransporter adhesin